MQFSFLLSENERSYLTHPRKHVSFWIKVSFQHSLRMCEILISATEIAPCFCVLHWGVSFLGETAHVDIGCVLLFLGAGKGLSRLWYVRGKKKKPIYRTNSSFVRICHLVYIRMGVGGGRTVVKAVGVALCRVQPKPTEHLSLWHPELCRESSYALEMGT